MQPARIMFALSCTLAACGSSSGSPDGGPRVDGAVAAAATARFAPPQPGAGAVWGQVPYPSDLYLDADGLLTVSDLPIGPTADLAFVNMLIETLHTMDGAGLWSSVHIAVDGELDPDSLAGNVHLVDLDDGLSEIPIDVVWRTDLGSIVAVPRYGTLLREQRRYGAYVTNQVRASDATALAAAPAFLAAADLATPPDDPALAAAQAGLRPLLEALDPGVRASVVVATVFRTETVGAEAVAMREVIAASPPVVTVEQTFSGAGQLDALFGVQDADAVPGQLHGSANFRAQPHGNVAAVIHGDVSLKNFLSDTPNTAGFATFAGGVPQVKSTDHARYTLFLPTATSYADLPVVIYVPGINRPRVDVMTQADTATDEGFALLTIDMKYHGDRATQPIDARNETTGSDTPDGFGDEIGLTPAVEFFHLTSSGGIPAYHPRAMRENLRQASMDVCSLVELVADGDLTPLNTALGGLGLPTDLSFRGDVALLTESFGALVSGPCVAVEPRIKVVMYSSPAAGMPFPSMMHSANYSGLFLGAVTNPFGIADRVVLGDPIRGPRFEPIIMLYNSALERGEISGFAGSLLAGDHRGGSGPSLAVSMAYADEWVSNDTTEHLAGVLGLPRLVTSAPTQPPGTGLRFVDLAEITGDATGNLAGGAQAAALTVYAPSAHASLRKLTDALEFEPDAPPFVRRTTPQPIDPTPIVALHTQWRTLFRSVFAGDTPTIVDPY